MKKIKNPLIRRIPKELIGDWKKYLVVFLFLVLTIGFVSGMCGKREYDYFGKRRRDKIQTGRRSF